MPNEVVVALVSAVLGAVLGGGGVLVILRGILNKVKTDNLTLDYLEKLYNSIPVEAVRDLFRDLIVVGDEITDGIPVVEKPAKG